MQAFNWASHLKHWIFKDDNVVWNGKRGGDNTDSEHKAKDLRSERGFELLMLWPQLKGY